MKQGDIVTYHPFKESSETTILYQMKKDCDHDESMCILDPIDKGLCQVRAPKSKCNLYPGDLRYEVTIKGSFPKNKYDSLSGKKFLRPFQTWVWKNNLRLFPVGFWRHFMTTTYREMRVTLR